MQISSMSFIRTRVLNSPVHTHVHAAQCVLVVLKPVLADD